MAEEIKEIKEKYTTDINMWGMEIQRINSMLEGLTNLKLYLRNPRVIKENPQIINSCADTLMELYITIDSYIKDQNKKITLFDRLEKLQEEGELIAKDYSNPDDEDYDNPEQLNTFYKTANHLHKDILEEIDILGLRIPFKKELNIESMLKKANR